MFLCEVLTIDKILSSEDDGSQNLRNIVVNVRLLAEDMPKFEALQRHHFHLLKTETLQSAHNKCLAILFAGDILSFR